jgi:hypothetical protein
MTFLAPWALWLGAVAAVPLALHLWQRRTAARVDFPAVRYLQRMAQDHAREVRVQNVLLLLLRLGIVLALALAAARPFAAVPAAGHPPVAMAVVLDNSLSSQAVTAEGPMLDRLRAMAAAILAEAGPEDELWLVTMDGVTVGGEWSRLQVALGEVAALDGAGEGSRALARAAAVVRESALPVRQVVVLTDGQRTSWDPATLASVAREGIAWRVAVPPLPWRPNHAVREAVSVPPVWGEGGAVRLRIAGADSVAWRVEVAGRPFARGTVGPDGTGLARGRPALRGWGAATVELTPDELRGDDRRHLAVRVGDPPAVEVDPSSGPFVTRAVEALIAAGRLRRGPGTLIGATARPGVTAVVLAPADPLRLPEVNRALERAGIPWRFGAPRDGETRITLGDPSTAEAMTAGPVTMVRRWYPLAAVPEATGARVDTLGRIGAAPWALRGDRYLLIASPLEPSATDLPLSARFVPWLGELLTQRLDPGEVGVIEAMPGARLIVPREVDALEMSDGTRRPVTAGGPLDAPWRAGVAFWRRGDARVGALVVNPEPSESDPARHDAAALARTLGATRLDPDPLAIGAATFATVGPRPLDRPLLLLALLLLLAEALVARRGRPARPSSAPD